MEMVPKPCQDRFMHPILVKENKVSQMGHTKKSKDLKIFLFIDFEKNIQSKYEFL